MIDNQCTPPTVILTKLEARGTHSCFALQCGVLMDGYKMTASIRHKKTFVVSIEADSGSYNQADSWLQDIEGAIAVDHC